MSNVIRPPFVISVPFSEGERFVIIRTDTMLTYVFPPKPPVKWPEAMQQFFAGEPRLTEGELRSKLADMGLGEAAVMEQIERARKVRQLNVLSSWDHITTIGFRNREGQEVVRKTGREGSAPAQRIFVLRCTVCGHEYGCDGCDIYDRLCPTCQDGSPGLPT